MLTGPHVILILKVAVIAVTTLLAGSVLALYKGNYRLHGRINLIFTILTASALVGLEVVARILDPQLFDYFERDPVLKKTLTTHLCFSLPSALLMPLMLFTGFTGRRRWHLFLAVVFAALWTGTFITGVFFLPHS
jgi:uncharacterized membrane protein YozB (DUF420 family)